MEISTTRWMVKAWRLWPSSLSMTISSTHLHQSSPPLTRALVQEMYSRAMQRLKLYWTCWQHQQSALSFLSSSMNTEKTRRWIWSSLHPMLYSKKVSQAQGWWVFTWIRMEIGNSFWTSMLRWTWRLYQTCGIQSETSIWLLLPNLRSPPMHPILSTRHSSSCQKQLKCPKSKS